jgi:dTDP-D-glucose 4,6-dehydratase
MLPVLVTGGCGFIGSNWVRYALANDPDLAIINLDHLKYAGSAAVNDGCRRALPRHYPAFLRISVELPL